MCPPSVGAVNLSAAPPGFEIILYFNPRLKQWAIVGRLVRLSIGVNAALRQSHSVVADKLSALRSK